MQPVAVVPNVGGEENAHLEVVNCKKWKKDFTDWLETDLKIDDLELSDDKKDSKTDRRNCMSGESSDLDCNAESDNE